MLNTGLLSAILLLAGVVSTATLFFAVIVNGINKTFGIEHQKLNVTNNWRWLFILAALLTVFHTGSKLIDRFFL